MKKHYLNKLKYSMAAFSILSVLPAKSFAADKYDVCNTVSLKFKDTASTEEMAKLATEITAKLEDLKKELKSAMESEKSKLMPETVRLLSNIDISEISPVSGLQGQVMQKTYEGLRNLASKFSFTARLTFLPVGMCNDIETDSVAKSNEGLSIVNYNKSDNVQRDTKLVGFNLNISYEVTQDHKNDELGYHAKVSGGVLVSLPTNYSYPFDINIQTPSFMPNMVLKDVFFEQDSRIPSQKHYVLFNFSNVNFTAKGLDFMSLDRTNGKNPEFHFFFTDQVNIQYKPQESAFIYFKEVLARPLRGLIGHIMTEKCRDELVRSPAKDLAFPCSLGEYVSLPINHLVLELEPYKVKTSTDDNEPIIITVPKIRAPIHSQNEEGGVLFALRMFAPFSDKTQREIHPWFNFYLNGDGLVTRAIGGGNMVNHGIDAGYKVVINHGAASVSYLLSFKKALEKVMQDHPQCDDSVKDNSSTEELIEYYYCHDSERSHSGDIKSAPDFKIIQ